MRLREIEDLRKIEGAIDAETGIEVTVMGPVHAARADLQKLAIAKLKRRLSRSE